MWMLGYSSPLLLCIVLFSGLPLPSSIRLSRLFRDSTFLAMPPFRRAKLQGDFVEQNQVQDPVLMCYINSDTGPPCTLQHLVWCSPGWSPSTTYGVASWYSPSTSYLGRFWDRRSLHAIKTATSIRSFGL
ncbi:hypothetical protein DAEQUDRAFT_155233 [Daedalea quercina L-15889]|uniref:Uncharacterized protein n=1 Tax=Daedalea quercina L-15889 TaxID=1314783 RepID=A0A165RNP6_9APHY|nr:hypothetical protein DAEQUDRAFT_155233 [Daedalea quercina L-15889]